MPDYFKEIYMTHVIPKKEWKRFFDTLSREHYGWETAVQVLDEASGAQMMSEGLAFSGMTLEEHGEHATLELLVGSDRDNHQTHNISDPTKIAFEKNQNGPGGTLDIEDQNGIKTLVNFYQPMPMMMEFVRSEILSVR
jgi:hypothetical protein